MEIASIARNTRYVSAVLESLDKLVHATNLELLHDIQQDYPEVSATTIHRVTARLYERGEIGSASKPKDGSMRYDVNPKPHHHFMCVTCDQICDVPDTDKSAQAIRDLKESSGTCALAGTLTLRGVCKQCYKEG